MSSIRRTTILPTILLIVGVSALAGCSGEKETKDTGTCGDLRYELSAETEKDVTEVSFELRSTAPGETWQVVIDQDGETILEGARATDEDAELDADTTVPADDAESTFTVTATPESGEPCVASLTH